MEESGQEIQFNVFDKQENEEGFIEVYGQQSQLGVISDKLHDKVEFLEESKEENQTKDLSGKHDGYVGSMEEPRRGSQVNEISERQVNKAESIEEPEQESRVDSISKKQENAVGSMGKLGQESQANDLSSNQDNHVSSMEEPGGASQVNDISERQENKGGSIKECEQESQVYCISKKEEAMVGSMVDSGQENQANCNSKIQEDEPTKQSISWNEAIRREHEYQKKMEKYLLQFHDSIEHLPIQSQELNLNAQIAGLKRKAPEIGSCRDYTDAENKVILLQKQGNQGANVGNLPGKPLASFLGKPGVCEQNISPCLQLHRKKIPQGQKQHSVPYQFMVQGASMQMVKKYWCHICRVQCPSLDSLAKHQQGKRHKNQVEILIQEKQKAAGTKIFWCQTCNVPCTGVVSMRQHLQGKKHQASIKMQVGTSRNVGIKLDAANADCGPMYSELCQPERSEASIKETDSTATVDATVPVARNQRLRTSNWPNYL